MGVALSSPLGLTRHLSTFDRRGVLLGICDRLPSGASVTAVEEVAERYMARAEVINLGGASSQPLRRADGKVVPLHADGPTFSTAELLAVEERLLSGALARRDTDCGVATGETVAGGPRGPANHLGRAGPPGGRARYFWQRGRCCRCGGGHGKDIQPRRRPRRLAALRLPGDRLRARCPGRRRAGGRGRHRVVDGSPSARRSRRPQQRRAGSPDDRRVRRSGHGRLPHAGASRRLCRRRGRQAGVVR